MRISRLTGPRTSVVEDRPDLEPAPGQLLVQVSACGVCTSDLSVWRAGPGDGRPDELGHEVAGTVLATGDPVTSRWRAGDVVTGLGGPGFATHVLMNEREALPVPDGIEPAHALGEPVATLAEALSRCPLAAGDRVAVVGAGFMGLGLIQLAATAAPGLLLGVDPVAAARDRALAVGADRVLHPDELAGEQVDLVIEATGVTAGLATAGSLVRPFGTLCVVGYHHAGTAPFDMQLWYRGATVVNGFCPQRPRIMAAMSAVLDLIAARRFSFAPLITHRFGLDGVDAAYHLLYRHGSALVKAVIEP
jgi:(R,R)-butanediol dehydrogenase/meso-butanediol dehydrogenase/diacetyl reductase